MQADRTRARTVKVRRSLVCSINLISFPVGQDSGARYCLALHFMDFELRQEILVPGEEFVGHLLDLSQREHGGCQWVVADGAVDHGRIASDGSGDGHLFDAARELGQQGTLGRQRTDVDRMEASLVHINRDLDTGAFGQVCYESCIWNIAVEFEGLTAFKGIDDIGGVLLAALDVRQGQRGRQAFPDDVLPGLLGVLVFLQDVGVFAGVPAGAMRAVFFDQVGALAEPPVVLRVVPARLGHVVAERQVHLVADDLLVVDLRAFGDGLVDERIGVLAVPLVFDVPGLVVDASAGVMDLVRCRPDPLRQHHGRALDRVAETRDRDVGLPLECAAQHGHRVGVVEQDGVRAVFLHVVHDVQHGQQGAQEAEDTARAARVADIDVHAEFLGDLDIVTPDLGAAGQDGGQDHVGARERLSPVEGGGDGCRALAGLDEPGHRLPDEFQPIGVDVHQGNVGVLEQGEGQDVAHEFGGEAEAAGADEGDFGHGWVLSFGFFSHR